MFFIYCCRLCIYLWMFVCLRLLYVSIFIYLFLICLRTCVWLRISVYSIRRSMYLMFFIPHVLQRKFRCGLCTLGKNFFLYKLFKFFIILTRYQHCALLLSYLKSGIEPSSAAYENKKLELMKIRMKISNDKVLY